MWWVSLEPIGPGEPAGLCPTPPTHPSKLLLWCVVRASLCHVLALLFQNPWPCSSRLTVLPSSALHLKVGEGSSRLSPLPAPVPSAVPEPRALSPSPSERTRVGHSKTGATPGKCALGPSTLSGQPGLSRLEARGPCPSTPTLPEEAPVSVYTHFLLGPLVSPQRLQGASPAARCLCRPLLSPCQFSSVLSEILICLFLHHFRSSISRLLMGVSDQICGRNSFRLPGNGAPCKPEGCPDGLCILDSVMHLLQAPVFPI